MIGDGLDGDAEKETEERRPPPAVMTWEGYEANKRGQLNLPGMMPVPMVAERAFLALAREWEALVRRVPGTERLPNEADDLALACLLLSVEWGSHFTEVAEDQMLANLALLDAGASLWQDKLTWRLSVASRLGHAEGSDAVRTLIGNLGHHSSSVRYWMMEIAWFAFPWLSPTNVSDRLIKNVAGTLVGPLQAAGLAARFFSTISTW